MKMSLSRNGILIFITFINAMQGLIGVRIIEIKVPSRVKTGDSVTLDCLFDLEGQSLYSLNWWLNNVQFYQFDPSEGNQQIIYETSGVQVDKAESNLRVVTLRNVTSQTAGEFKCEIVADFPSYERDSLTSPMEVIDLPNKVPVISLEKSHYAVGDHLRANCTAFGISNLPVILWHLNGKKINFKHMKHIGSSSSKKVNDDIDFQRHDARRHKRRRSKSHHALTDVVSHVSMELKKSHFSKDGRSILTCTAIYAGVYHRAIRLDISRPEAPSVKPSLRVAPETSYSKQHPLQSTISLMFFSIFTASAF